MKKPICEKCAYYEKPNCQRYPTYLPRTPDDWCGEHDQFKGWYIKTHQNLNVVDTSEVKTKAELGESGAPAKPFVKPGGEVCAECDQPIVNGKCKCGHGY
jgi:hypothetical protein